MRIGELLKIKETTISFEVFPPKSNASFEPVMNAVDEMSELSPDFMSVTYRQGSSTVDNTVQVASHIQNDLNTTALAHLTCVTSNMADVSTIVEQLKANNIENVLALRGDIPDDKSDISTDFKYAYELIDAIKEKGDFSIGCACYPEGHVEAANKNTDMDYLKKKVEHGCDFLITQMFFDNSVLYSFLYNALKKGIDKPVIAGVMPVTNSRQIDRMCELSGTTLTSKFRAIYDKFGDNPVAFKQAGIAYATEQIVDLVSNGIDGIHIYAMNKPDIVQKIMTNISGIF
ncbi:MAG TPA: methylenetetrahydrofolate reductase [NAD(P)H] [Clostridia bacterium]|nr:methylenetetrahydrofolate reductase [NAD(P)H] [Clostridia bacterium]